MCKMKLNFNLHIIIEIKSSMTFNPSFLKSLEFFQKLNPERSPQGFLIYAGDQEQKIHNISLLNYKHASSSLKSLA